MNSLISFFYTTTESDFEYSNENDAPYIDNVVYVSCAGYDWCTWEKGMFYFSMRKPEDTNAGNLLYFVRTRSMSN